MEIYALQIEAWFQSLMKFLAKYYFANNFFRVGGRGRFCSGQKCIFIFQTDMGGKGNICEIVYSGFVCVVSLKSRSSNPAKFQ